jgi:hypothetical protein
MSAPNYSNDSACSGSRVASRSLYRNVAAAMINEAQIARIT